jgi:hypothetical protein
MMKRKALLLFILVLLGSSIYLLAKLLNFPRYAHGLLLNEESYYKKVNEARTRDAFNVHDRMERDAGRTMVPTVRAAVIAAARSTELLKISNTHLERALAWRAYPDSVKANLAVVALQLEQLFHLYEQSSGRRFSQYIMLEEIDGLPEDLVGLAIVRAQYDIGLYYWYALEEFSSHALGSTYKIDTWQSLMEGHKDPTWIKGQIAFNAPVAMHLNRKERVQVRISRKFVAGMVESMRRKESVTMDSIMVSDIMLVRLLGDEFKITAFDDEEQGVTEQGYTQWEFDVTPLQDGEHDLGATKKYFPVYEKKVQVQVTVWQQVAGFATERWEFILSSIIIPVGVWFIAYLRQRRKVKNQSGFKD